MPTAEVSRYNADWGICGFTSALTHLYDSDERLKAKIDTKNENTIKMGLLIEVVTFLKYVTAFRKGLIKGLNDLNKDHNSLLFGDGVPGFIKVVEEAVRKAGEGVENWEQVGLPDNFGDLFQCALTEEAMTLYLQEMCGYKEAKLTMGDNPGKCGILGLYKGEALKHWVYQDAAGNIYNWGDFIKPEEWKTHKSGLAHGAFDRVGCYISFD